MFETCIGFGRKENERIKTNLVRCLGNLLRLIEPQFPLIKDSIDVICRNITSHESMKLKWNASYAAHCLLKNEQLYALQHHPQVFSALCQEARKSSNFKVKTSAVNALGAPWLRSHYGTQFGEIFTTLTLLLIDSNNLADFNEYKHKELLQEESCLGIGHLLNLAAVDDLPALLTVVSGNSDVLKPIWRRCVNRMVPEKAEKIYRISRHLQETRSSAVSADQRRAIESLEGCFVFEELF